MILNQKIVAGVDGLREPRDSQYDGWRMAYTARWGQSC